jgi:hypothetical protein
MKRNPYIGSVPRGTEVGHAEAWSDAALAYGQELVTSITERLDLLAGQVEVIPLNSGLLIAQTSLEGAKRIGNQPVAVADQPYDIRQMSSWAYDLVVKHVAVQRKVAERPSQKPPYPDSKQQRNLNIPSFFPGAREPITMTFVGHRNYNQSTEAVYTDYGKSRQTIIPDRDLSPRPGYNVLYRPAVFMAREHLERITGEN